VGHARSAAHASQQLGWLCVGSPSIQPSLDDNQFTHDNVRCICSCPDITTALFGNETVVRSGCSTQDVTYIGGDVLLRGEVSFLRLGGELIMQETCTVCVNDDRSSRSENCKYVVVVGDQSQWFDV
jgi:hypothetical protein